MAIELQTVKPGNYFKIKSVDWIKKTREKALLERISTQQTFKLIFHKDFRK